MELATLLTFGGVLILCILFHLPLLAALLFGLGLFCFYAQREGHSKKEILQMVQEGIRPAKNILLVFVLIGILTALWRASGTIPTLICYALPLIRPKTLVLTVFLLNCGISLLTGTSFGTAATMGVISMTMGRSLGADPLLLGGAILSGVYFGDRCSPVSTSALLISQLTATNIFDNIKKMLRTALLPFLLTCLFYALAGLFSSDGGSIPELRQLFSQELALHWSALLPAVLLLLLSLLRLNIKAVMASSILASAFLCLFLQKISFPALLQLSFAGYQAQTPAAAELLNGGGIFSMVKVMAIVCISSSYAGIFQSTGLLKGIKGLLARLSKRISPFGSILVTALCSAMLSCNQTLSILLTHQLCRDLVPDPESFAVDLENSAVMVAPLVPWSIAGAVPLASAGAPAASLLTACFLYLVPLFAFLSQFAGKRENQEAKTA